MLGMAANQTLEHRAGNQRDRKWWKRALLGSLVGITLCLAIGIVYLIHYPDRALHAAIAEADRLDPGWRMADLQAKRAVIPDEENSALVITAALKLLPASWPFLDFSQAAENQNLLWSLEPPVQLDDRQIATLRQELARAAEALKELRKLVGLPRGRYPNPTAMYTLTIGRLLAYDALLRAQDKDLDGALASCQAILNAGRASGDEPGTIPVLIRLALNEMAIRKVERTLAQGEPSEVVLASIQQELEQEANQPLLLVTARFERAEVDQIMQAVENENVDLGLFVHGSGWIEQIRQYLHIAGTAKGTRAALLKSNNALVEIAKLPVEQQIVGLRQLRETEKLIPPVFVESTFAHIRGMIAGNFHRDQAELRCAVVMLALERYRRANNRWPETLKDLAPAFLAKVPLDPFDAAPLRYRRLDGGVVVYSIGPDGEDNGGKFDRDANKPGTDLGFRLWDVPHRRQPPKAASGEKP
jgi:hypothetical protein